MPYEKRESGDNWEVVNKDTQEVVGTHEPPDAEDKADRQIALLHEVEKEYDKDEGHD